MGECGHLFYSFIFLPFLTNCFFPLYKRDMPWYWFFITKSRSLRRKALQRSWHPTAYAMRLTSPTTKLGISVTSLGSDRLHTWKPLWGQTNFTAFWVATHWNNQKKHWSCSGTGTKHSSHHSSCFKIQSSQPSCRTAYLYMCMETRELHTKKRGFWLLLGNLPLLLVPAMHQIRDLQKPLMMLAYLWTFWRQHCRHAMYQQFVQKRLGVLHFLYVYKCQASCIYTNGIPKV